ncbi:hypothetical protein LSM04_005155 [Trypanosoma melophagium]|uniref:uncharacterized protein n=1 Tax=Trypanosoma melophagium TaxID=715481 RepID=UPI00351A9BCA|nr:hypothetical protein LSM04_005155 [Trypanosoma melophagium]
MARGRRAGSTSAAAAAAASGVGRGGRKTPLETSQSISASLQHVSPADFNDRSLIAGGRGRGKRGRPAGSHTTAQRQQPLQQQQLQEQEQPQQLQQQRQQVGGGGILSLQPGNPIVSFWKSFCRHDALTQALANIGTMIEAESPLLVTSSRLQYPFSGLSTDRLLVAIQAIVDAAALTESYDNNEDNDSLKEKRSKTWEIIQNLVQLAEAAVPMKFSALCGSAVVNGISDTTTTSTSSSAIFAIPPTTPRALRDRLRRLKRLWQLHEVHTRILPSLRECKSKSDIITLLFGTTQDKDNTIESMPEITSLHNDEQTVINDLMEEVNKNSLCTELCGTISFPPLRVSAGCYIIHRRSRFEFLRHLLNVAEYFGLPPFLRYIRVNCEQTRSSLDHSQMAHMPFTVSNTESHLDGSPPLPPPLLFPSPCDLDPCRYKVSVPKQFLTVQEELIELANNYCCFVILVGEADQILLLLRTSTLYQEEMRTGRGGTTEAGTIGVVKLEQSNGNPLPDIGKGEVKSDPLLSYAQLFFSTSNEDDTKRRSVHWLCDNRWNCSMKYYALVLAVLIPHNDVCEDGELEEVEVLGEQKGCEEEEVEGRTKEGEKSSRESVSTMTPYYVAAVLELTRS